MSKLEKRLIKGWNNVNIFVNLPKGKVRDSFITDDIILRLQSISNLTFNESNAALAGEELNNRLLTTDVLITGWGQPAIKKEYLGNVKLIAHTGGTVGGIIDFGVFDTDVRVLSGNRYYARSVAEGVIGYMLFMLRNMGKYSSDLKNGEWVWDAHTEGLIEQEVGLVSLGSISRNVIEMLRPYNCKIKVYSTRPNEETARNMGFSYAGLDEIFQTCKVVSVHTAKCPQTYHMINEKHFKMLQNGAIFINTSRGAVIDEKALIESLKENRFRALLDVYEKEPLSQTSELLTLENVVVFPHQAGPTFDKRSKITEYLIDDIESYFNGGEMLNEITKEIATTMTMV